ncbi:MAG: insulinase family protein [Clostridiales bacterium]|nr:insulinase family protein [Clostridiales bacterium]
MKLETGSVIKGFKVERIRESKELGGRFIEMRHEKVGTELNWLDNGDANKLFCVGFKTLPEDSTGVFHILEHSVLCGSKKYPVKEPFVDLMKSSMQTFLNAMTFPDKTIYPVSSRNERDFLNLTEVYLDAVFAPRCVVDPNAFRQEGWHLEVGEDGKPFFNGVVYNEMKGATSGIDEIIQEGITALLFPDNCYGFNSGGDPVNIPDLTYDMYRAMYRKYYNPSNARIYLDGSVPLEKTLDLINEYLGSERFDSAHEIPMQAMVPRENTLTFEIGPDEDPLNRSVVAYARIYSDYSDIKRCMMAQILCSLLADTNEAPLTRAILKEGLGTDVDLSFEPDIQQGVISLVVRNTEADKAARIREVAEEVVSSLLEKGLDKTLLTAQLNRYAFRVKDMQEPAGLFRCIMSYQGSLYGGDPMLWLEYDETIKELREDIENGNFDAALKEMFDFGMMSKLVVLPSKEHGDKLRKEEAERAEKMYKAMSEADIAELNELNDRLHAWQEAPDSEEDTATIPVLPLDEVSPDPLDEPTDVCLKNGLPVIYHAIPSQGITHLNLYFTLTDLDVPSLSAASLLCQLYTKLPTKRHSVSELQTEIKTNIGRLKFEINASMRKPEACTPYLAVFCDVLDENLGKAMDLVVEIITETVFDETDRIMEIVAQLDEMTKQRAIMAGHMLGMYAVTSHYLSSGVVNEAASGYTFRSFIKELAADFEAKKAELVKKLESIRDNSIVRSRLTVSQTANEKHCVKPLVEALPEGLPAPAEVHYDSPLPDKMGVRIPAQVSFAEKGVLVSGNDGSMKVAASIISLSHLWNRVRVQGGAYGAGMRVSDRGVLCHYTYRDPSPARSLDVFGEEADFVKSFCGGSEDITKFIISTVGNTEPLRSPAEQGAEADMNYFDGVTYEKRRKVRAQMLATDKEKLMAFAKELSNCAANGAVCVVGCDSALKEIEGITVFDL